MQLVVHATEGEQPIRNIAAEIGHTGPVFSSIQVPDALHGGPPRLPAEGGYRLGKIFVNSHEILAFQDFYRGAVQVAPGEPGVGDGAFLLLALRLTFCHYVFDWRSGPGCKCQPPLSPPTPGERLTFNQLLRGERVR